MKLVYHYCSYKTLIAIMENKSIRLHDIKKSNDQNEMVMWINDYITVGHDIDKKFGTGFWGALEDYMVAVNESAVCMATCFSYGEDMLSQWERYADRGYGVAIGVEVETLNQIAEQIDNRLKNMDQEDRNAWCISGDVKYCKKKKDIPLTNLTYAYEEKAGFLQTCALTKHIGFKEEREHRIAMLFFKEQESLILSGLQSDIIRGSDFNEWSGKTYLDIAFPVEKIKRIFIGPLLKNILDANHVKKIVRSMGCNCPVTESEIPYIPK